MTRMAFRRPGAAWPDLIVHERTAGRYGPDEPAPLDWNFRKTRGEFCGDGSLTLSRPPVGRDGTLMRPGDWVQFWLPGDADDDPSYLGFVHSEPWHAGEGEILLKSPLYFVEMCAWKSLLDANKVPLFDEGTIPVFLAAVLARASLPTGITVGNLGTSSATVKARTDFELLKDTIAGIKPALEGGEIGVNARGQIGVYEPQEIIRHRFPKSRSERPAGSLDGYANSVTFPYTRPDLSVTQFEFIDTQEAVTLGRGRIYVTEQLPAIIQAAKYLPPPDPVPVTLYVGDNTSSYDPDVTRAAPLTANLPVRDPAWAGKLSDVLGNASLAALWGQQVRLPPDPTGNDVPFRLTIPVSQVSETGRLEVLKTAQLNLAGEPGVTMQIRYAKQGQLIDWADVGHGTLVQALDPVVQVVSLRYKPEAYAAYVTAQGQPPRGIDVEVRGSWERIIYDPNGVETGRSTLPPDAYPMSLRVQYGTAATGVQSLYASLSVPFATTRPVVPDPGLLLQVDLDLPAHEWLQGSSVWVKNGVKAKLRNATETLDLGPGTQTDDNGEYGTRWGVPRDFTATGLTLNLNPRLAGKVLMTGVDYGPLRAYARGLLRYRTRPVRRWTGTYHDLKRVPALDLARFETNGPDEEVLDVQAVTYDAKSRTPKVDAGTPFAVDLGEAIERSAYNLEQRIRAVNQ